MNIYVGNLAYQVNEDELRTVFEAHGQVEKVKIIVDRETGRSRSFGFVEMPDGEEGKVAIEALNGTELSGRPMRINEARPRNNNFSGGGGGGGGNRGGGGGGGRQGGRSYNRY